jgi:hypothetical protein
MTTTLYFFLFLEILLALPWLRINTHNPREDFSFTRDSLYVRQLYAQICNCRHIHNVKIMKYIISLIEEAESL